MVTWETHGKSQVVWKNLPKWPMMWSGWKLKIQPDEMLHAIFHDSWMYLMLISVSWMWILQGGSWHSFALVGGVFFIGWSDCCRWSTDISTCQSFQFNKQGFPSSLVIEEVEIDANPPARRRASRVLNFQMRLKASWSTGEILLAEFWDLLPLVKFGDGPGDVWPPHKISGLADWSNNRIRHLTFSSCRLFWYVVWSPPPVLVAISRNGFCKHSTSLNSGWFTTLADDGRPNDLQWEVV